TADVHDEDGYGPTDLHRGEPDAPRRDAHRGDEIGDRAHHLLRARVNRFAALAEHRVRCPHHGSRNACIPLGRTAHSTSTSAGRRRTSTPNSAATSASRASSAAMSTVEG